MCLSSRVSTCLPTSLLSCLPSCLSISLSFFLSVWLPGPLTCLRLPAGLYFSDKLLWWTKLVSVCLSICFIQFKLFFCYSYLFTYLFPPTFRLSSNHVCLHAHVYDPTTFTFPMPWPQSTCTSIRLSNCVHLFVYLSNCSHDLLHFSLVCPLESALINKCSQVPIYDSRRK